MDKQERERLRALAQAATPGPWVVSSVSVGDENAAVIRSATVLEPVSDADERGGCYIAQTGYDGAWWCERPEPFNKTTDGEFIAAANPDVVLHLLDALDAAEQRAALDAEQRGRWTRQAAALLGDFERRDQVRRAVDLDDASLLARAIELLRSTMPQGKQTGEGGA